MSELIMAMNYEQIIEALDALNSNDFDLNEADGQHKLYVLTDELLQQPNPERAIPALFAVMERMPKADLGSPGPLVHTLEKFKNYELELKASLLRAPCLLSVLMVNSILNTTTNSEQREAWLNLLDSVVANPDTTSGTKQAALHFIKFQKERFK
jgi:hypothetical protein